MADQRTNTAEKIMKGQHQWSVVAWLISLPETVATLWALDLTQFKKNSHDIRLLSSNKQNNSAQWKLIQPKVVLWIKEKNVKELFIAIN